MLATIFYYLFKYGGAAEAIIAVTLIIRSYLNSDLRKELKSYQEDISRSQEEILKLEEQNQNLQNLLRKVQGSF